MRFQNTAFRLGKCFYSRKLTVGVQSPKYLFHMQDNIGGMFDSISRSGIGGANSAGFTGANQFKFTSGTSLGGSSSDLWTLPSALSFAGDFGIDLWLNPTSSCSNCNSILSAKNPGYNPQTLFGFDTAFKLGFWNNSNLNAPTMLASTAMTSGVMQHAAITRKGSTVRIFLNGVVVATATISGTINFGLGGKTVLFENGQTGVNGTNGSFKGYVDELRICEFCPWDEAFTPPTAPYADPLPPTSLPFFLMHMDGANGSTAFVDSGSTSLSLAANGGAQVSTAASQFGGSSLALNGTSGCYVESSAPSVVSRLSGNDFTIDFRVKFNSMAGWNIIAVHGFNPADTGFYLATSSGGICFAYGLGTGTASVELWTPFSLMTTGAFYNVRVTRIGSTLRIFINGTLRASSTISVPIASSSTDKLRIGGLNPTTTINGNIDEFYILNGYALNVGDYVPPTAAYTS